MLFAHKFKQNFSGKKLLLLLPKILSCTDVQNYIALSILFAENFSCILAAERLVYGYNAFLKLNVEDNGLQP